MGKSLALMLAALAIAGPATAETYHVTGDIEVTIIPPAGCVITAVNLPTKVSVPAANHDMTVGSITFNSNIPCTVPPGIVLTSGSVFALAGNTLPTDLKFGSTDVTGGVHPFAGDVTTAASRAQSQPAIMVPVPAPR